MLGPAGDVLIFIFGVIVGSFLNVVIYRYNTGAGFRGRSRCLSCRHRLAARDLVPLVSYLINRGRCRYCGSKISLQYPAIELLTGLIFVLLAWRFFGTWPDWPVFTLHAVLASLLLVIAAYDWRHQIIPDGLAYLFIGLSFFRPVLVGLVAGSPAVVVISGLNSLLAAGLFLSAFGLLWLVSGGRWVGWGDGKLAFGIGILLGLSSGLSALALGFWLGAISGLLLLLASRRRWPGLRKYFTLKSEIPFAPFLVAGAILTMIFDLHVLPF